MRLFYGSISFTPSFSNPNAWATRMNVSELGKWLKSFSWENIVVLFDRCVPEKGMEILFALAPAQSLSNISDSEEMALYFNLEWESERNQFKHSAYSSDVFVQSVRVSPHSEGSFMAAVNVLFQNADPTARADIVERLAEFRAVTGDFLSPETHKALDVALAYKPPKEEPESPPKYELKRQAGRFMLAVRGDEAGEPQEPTDQDAALTAPILQKLEALTGLGEFKAYLRDLEAARRYLSKWKGRPDFPDQHLLFSVDPGNGCTTAAGLLHEYLNATGLHGGKSDYSFSIREHRLPYPEENNLLTQLLQETLSDAEDAIKHTSPGVLTVYIEEWINKLESPAFVRFLEACRKNRHEVTFLFVVPYLNEGVLARVLSRLRDVLNVRLLRFHPYSTEELTQAARQQLGEFGVGWDDSADAPFHQLLEEERADTRFYGMQTIKKITSELLLMKSHNVCVRHIDAPADVLTAADFQSALPPDDGLSGSEQLDALIGLTEVKKRVRELVVSILAEKEYGGEKAAPCLHMLFTGSPGTGKTTVARILGKIFREEGLLRVGDLIEVNRFDLVGEYIGTTGPKTVERCRSATGSILFIDEAYLLFPYRSDDGSRDFGVEALGALVAEMENRRDRFMVIMAGYSEEMEGMLSANPGLRGRIPHTLHFPNYTRGELFEIFKSQMERYDCDEELLAQAEAFFLGLGEEFFASKEFGNARFVRNLTERLRIKALLRLQGEPRAPGGRLRLIALDLESALADEDMKVMNRKEKKRRIGFAYEKEFGR